MLIRRTVPADKHSTLFVGLLESASCDRIVYFEIMPKQREYGAVDLRNHPVFGDRAVIFQTSVD